jgi:ATP-dependent RNA helicase HelY
VVTATRKVLLVGEGDLHEPPEPIGSVPLPTPFAPRNPAFQRQVAEALHRLPGPRGGRRRPSTTERSAPPVAWTHPVADCPDRDVHVRAAKRLRRGEREVTELRRRVVGHSGSLARRFDLVLSVLRQWGHLDDWSLTPRGERLVRIYHEADLLIAEALHEGLFDGLDVPSVVALASTFTYEHRSPGPPPAPWFPTGELRGRWARLERLHADLAADEVRLGLPVTRVPDPGFVPVAHGWASGGDLDDVLLDEEVTPGDFVRNVKQLVDLLRQLGDAAPDASTAAAARAGADAVFRGVVSASAVVAADAGEDDDDWAGAGVDDDLGPEDGVVGGTGDLR